MLSEGENARRARRLTSAFALMRSALPLYRGEFCREVMSPGLRSKYLLREQYLRLLEARWSGTDSRGWPKAMQLAQSSERDQFVKIFMALS